MYRGFIEYKVDATQWDTYKTAILGKQEQFAKLGLKSFEFSESVDRPGQFLEMFLVSTPDESVVFADPSWKEWEIYRNSLVINGPESVKRWFFRII